MADYIQIKNGSTDAYPTIKPSVYRKEFNIGPVDAVYDDGYIDVTVPGKTPISVGWSANQIDTNMYMLTVDNNVVWYGRCMPNGLKNNSVRLFVLYI